MFQSAAFIRDPAAGLEHTEKLLSDNAMSLCRCSLAHVTLCRLQEEAKKLFDECDEELNKGKHEFKRNSSIFDMKVRFADLSNAIDAARKVDRDVNMSLAAVKPELTLLCGPADNIRKALPSSVRCAAGLEWCIDPCLGGSGRTRGPHRDALQGARGQD